MNMVCRHKSTKTKCKPEVCVLDALEDTGREQFFWHYPLSELPIRDITQKTEPHIEIGAENYLRPCLQPNVRGFCRSREKYLFLCTTCKNQRVGNGDFVRKRFVVGYIKKENCIRMDCRWAAVGEVYMVPFNEKLSYDTLGFNRSRGMQGFGRMETEKLLGLIHSHRNIVKDCIKEMREKEDEARRERVSLPIDEECLGKECTLQGKCLRKKLK
jgi:hypothetical protein